MSFAQHCVVPTCNLISLKASRVPHRAGMSTLNHWCHYQRASRHQHTWNRTLEIHLQTFWFPCQHGIHWQVVGFEDKMFNNCVLRPCGIPSIDFDQLSLNFMGLKHLWKLWNPDIALKNRVWFMHAFISFTTVKRRRPAAHALIKKPMNTPKQRGAVLTRQSIICKCFDQPGKWTAFSASSQSF